MHNPAPSAAPDPVTLFYPVDSEQLSPAAAGVIAVLFVPIALLFAFVFAPALLLWIPIVFINHWVNKTPLEFNPIKAVDHYEKLIQERNL
ncbi:MAG: hypothetical protein ACO236_00385 [Candidatus Nanopelagicaceae bacterium]